MPLAVVVGLHGWGANAEDLASLASLLNLPNYQFLFPDAPLPHPYSNGGKMWYSLPNNIEDRGQLEEELADSRNLLESWLVNLPKTTGVSLERTFLMGFSQGGAMTLEMGFKFPLAGLIVLSGYLHSSLLSTKVALPPILMVHGKQDSVVPVSQSRLAYSSLTAMGAKVEYHELDMGHEIRPEVLPMIEEFIGRQA